MSTNQSYMRYWGKVKRTESEHGANFHLLPFHSLDVAAVTWCYLEKRPKFLNDIAQFLSLECSALKQLLVFFSALHDLGKFASSFQNLYTDTSGFLVSEHANVYDGKEYRHDRLGLFFWQYIWKGSFLPKLLAQDSDDSEEDIEDGIMQFVNCALGHHGRPCKTKHTQGLKKFTRDHNVIASIAFFDALFDMFQPEVPVEQMRNREWQKRLALVSWQLAGLYVVSDWVGSDNSHFPFESAPRALKDYWQDALVKAEIALDQTDLVKPLSIQPYRSIQDQFNFEPTPLQQWAESIPVNDSPQLFILEDITGSGKTEAALALTHRLLLAGAADGFYFGLPTMATSNAMFSRVASQYLSILSSEQGVPSIVLAHGARDMSEQFQEAILHVENPSTQYNSEDQTATAQCNQWLADSRKKALLAPVGVGTIDQALLAVLPRRHQSLRLLGMARKVLIFDEIHAADDYMFELLESLLALHLHQGGSAILLTATLSKRQRQRLITIWQKAAGLVPEPIQNTAFPLATKVSIDQVPSLQEISLKSRPDVCRSVAIRFVHTFENCIERILQAVQAGECVVWVRNSVDDALEAYEALVAAMTTPSDCLLFHSRFILEDRKRIEANVLDWFGKESNGRERKGKVLVATQVFQESLDADADLLVSDLCPIDDLIQRAGRLHRHTRDAERTYVRDGADNRQAPELWLHCPEWTLAPSANWLTEKFRNTQYVYRSPGRLWLAYRKLREAGAIVMPDQARALIEAVYGENAKDDIPESLVNLEKELEAEERSKAHVGKSAVLDWKRNGYSDQSAATWYEDDIDISTRFSDIETVEVLLVRLNERNEIEPWVGSQKNAIALSTVKLAKHKFADRLAAIPEKLEPALDKFKAHHKAAKYLQCWLPELDPDFSYSPNRGFSSQTNKEVK
ncbi:CRISPR-associated helicase Cas3' [Reinekea sp. G2M2-21]|uniref:CRISPR-associated helicase Cas3' n=1 Tax=Reinekea sp. G2M2-21 TaxID=2788942 RepID=UPI0018A9FD97|nr:CRISPR-associated helicase Cas3' [Reinekea sp. G2M2-21]